MSKVLSGQKYDIKPEEVEIAVGKKHKSTTNNGHTAISKLRELSVEYVSLDSIYPNEWNPNRQTEYDFELLLKSIEEDGFTQPIIISSDGKIIDGEHRWRAAKVLGLKQVPAVRVKMTDAQMRVATIRHNRARGSHDVDAEMLLLKDLCDMEGLDWLQDALVMDDGELEQLLKDVVQDIDSFVDNLDPEEQIENQVEVESIHVDENRYNQLKQVAEGSRDTSTDCIGSNDDKTDGFIGKIDGFDPKAWADRDMRMYRVSILFTGDDSVIVREALGKDPASKLLELCKNELGAKKIKVLLQKEHTI